MVSLRSAEQALTTLLFLVGITLAASIACPWDIDIKSRVGIDDESGLQYCTECEQLLEDCDCQCPGCEKPFRTIKLDHDSEPPEQDSYLWEEVTLLKVSTENCCQCHLEEGNPYYCGTCLLTLNRCNCFSEESSIEEISDPDSSPEKTMKLSSPFGDDMFIYSGAGVLPIIPRSSDEPQVVPNFAGGVPTLECCDTSSPSKVAGISDTACPSGLLRPFKRRRSLTSNTADPSEFNQPNFQDQDMLSAQFSPSLASQVTPLEDESSLTQVLNGLNDSINNSTDLFGAAIEYLKTQAAPPAGATPVQDIPFLKIFILNDHGTFRALSSISHDRQTLYLFINKSGNLEVYISYAENDAALGMAIISSELYVMTIHAYIEHPLQGLEALWLRAVAILEKQPNRPVNVIRTEKGFASTTRRPEVPVRIEQPRRESQSQRLARILRDNISATSPLELFTNPVSNLQLLAYNLGVLLIQKSESWRFAAGTTASPEDNQPTEGTDSLNILGDQYNFVDEFSSDTWLSSLQSDVSLIFVINHHNPFNECPLIIHVTLGTFQDQLVLITYNPGSNSPDISDPIILPSGGFVRALQELIKRISENYRIRFFEQDRSTGTKK